MRILAYNSIEAQNYRYKQMKPAYEKLGKIRHTEAYMKLSLEQQLILEDKILEDGKLHKS